MTLKSNIGLTTLAIFTTLLLLEGGLRLAGEKPRSTQPNRYLAETKSWAEPHPILGWKNRAGTFHSVEQGNAPMTFDQTGRRHHPQIKAKKNSPSILVIGGSFAGGYGVTDQQTFSYLLDKTVKHHQVINFGTGGHSSWQAYLRLQSYLTNQNNAKPALILYAMIDDHRNRNIADFSWINYLTTRNGEKLIPPHLRHHNNRFKAYKGSTVPLWPLEAHSALMTKIHQAVLLINHQGSESEKNKVTLEIIKRMQQTADEHGSTFLLVMLTEIDPELMKDLEKTTIKMLDCHTPGWHRNPNLRVGGQGHPNAAYHQKYATCLKQWIDKTHLPAQ